jgi:protocatechuate 3,4-dioxygenase beta subunit
VDDRLAYATALSTNDGSWGIEGLPPGRYRIWAVPDDSVNHPPRFYPSAFSYCEGEKQVLVKGAQMEDLDVLLPEGGRIHGTLLDESGAPIVGARVEAEGTQHARSYRRRTTTNGDGAFEIRGLEAPGAGTEAYTFEVDAEGYPTQFLGPTYVSDESEWVEIGLGEASDLGELGLLLGQGVAGRVQSEGLPVVGANVFIYAEGQILDALTDEDGLYEAWALPPGEVLVWASSEGHGLTYFPDVDRPIGTMPGAGEGELLDGVDIDMPVESALNLQLTGAEGDLSGVTVLAYNDTYTVGLGARSGPEGNVRIGRLFPGSYAVFVYATPEGFVDDFIRDESGEVLSFEVGDQETDILDYSLPRGGILAGQVVDERGTPVYGAMISAIPEDPTGRTRSAFTNHEGTFLIDGIVPGPVLLRGSYTVYCGDDLGHVSTWWPSALLEERAAMIQVKAGSEQWDLEIEMAQDFDHDSMGDAWEREHGLDPSRDDGAEDPDGDGFSNLEEYLLGTDPNEKSVTDGCGGGCGGSGKEALLLLPLTLLGLGRRRSA